MRVWGRTLGLSVVLLLLLVFLAYRLQSSTLQPDWSKPVQFLIYPINADGADKTAEYLAQLTHNDFIDIEQFFIREAQRYRTGITHPVRVELQPPVEGQPPETPDEPSILESLWWGLRMRLWVGLNEQFSANENAIRVFMNFYSLEAEEVARHSLGLQKGRIGLVNGYADARVQGVNNFVAVHEALHTLGAHDRYDPKSAEPVWPDGYADPVQVPLFPQTRAEVMGGRMQVVPGWAVLPPSLDHVMIGPLTATEIGWRNPDLVVLE